MITTESPTIQARVLVRHPPHPLPQPRKTADPQLTARRARGEGRVSPPLRLTNHPAAALGSLGRSRASSKPKRHRPSPSRVPSVSPRPVQAPPSAFPSPQSAVTLNTAPYTPPLRLLCVQCLLAPRARAETDTDRD
jgi:hypothetical protein